MSPDSYLSYGVIAAGVAIVAAAFSKALGDRDGSSSFLRAWWYGGVRTALGAALGTTVAWITWGGPSYDWDLFLSGIVFTLRGTAAGALGGGIGPSMFWYVLRKLITFFPRSFPMKPVPARAQGYTLLSCLGGAAGCGAFLPGFLLVLFLGIGLIPGPEAWVSGLQWEEAAVCSLVVGGMITSLLLPWLVQRLFPSPSTYDTR